MKNKCQVKNIEGNEYTICRTHKFRLSGGYAGQKGIEVWKKGDTSQTTWRGKSLAEFRKYLKDAKKYSGKGK